MSRTPAFLLGAAVFCPSLHVQAQEPAVEFVRGDLDDLSCRVTRTLPSGKSSVLVLVEVRNKGEATAEPAAFSLAARGVEPFTIDRLPQPHARRRGRGVPAGGKQDYWVQVATEESLRRAKASVTKALFYEGEPLAEAPLSLGGMRHAQLEDQGMRVDASTIGVTNTSSLPLDVVLLGTFTQPYSDPALLTLRLQPAERKEWQVTLMPRELKWWGAGGTYGVKIEGLEAVDWSVVLPEDADAVREAALTAYRSWLRWDKPYPGLTGRFVLRVSRTDRNGGKPETVRGTFRLKDIAPPFADIEGSAGIEVRSDLEKALTGAFADLRRPAAEEIASTCSFRTWDMGDVTKVEVAGPAWPHEHGRILWLSEGRIVGLEEARAQGQYWEEWQVRPEGEGYLVVGRRHPHALNDNLVIERYDYARLGSLLVPVTWYRQTRYGDFRHVIELSLHDLEHAGAAPGRQVVQGAGAEAVRAAWDSTYAYPDQPVTLRARFELDNPGNDDLWEGQRSVEGTVRLQDFTGFRQDNSGWSGYEIEIAGRGMSEALKTHLAFAVEDRLRMWAYRDFAGRAAFDVAFAGARIEPLEGEGGGYEVTNGPVTRLRVADGKIAEMTFADGRVRELKWRAVAGQHVAQEIATGAEELTARFRRVADGWLLPTRIRFEGVFPDWGPETLELKDVKVQ